MRLNESICSGSAPGSPNRCGPRRLAAAAPPVRGRPGRLPATAGRPAAARGRGEAGLHGKASGPEASPLSRQALADVGIPSGIPSDADCTRRLRPPRKDHPSTAGRPQPGPPLPALAHTHGLSTARSGSFAHTSPLVPTLYMDNTGVREQRFAVTELDVSGAPGSPRDRRPCRPPHRLAPAWVTRSSGPGQRRGQRSHPPGLP